MNRCLCASVNVIARFNCGALPDAGLDGEAEALRSLRMRV
jgi:hypothetical protein